MANEKNLKKIQLSHEEAVKNGKKGAEKRTENIRKRKTLRELAVMLGQLQVTGKAAKAMEEMGIAQNEQVRDTAMLLSLQKKAMGGDVQAIKLLAQMQGELTNSVELTGKDGAPIQTEQKVVLDDIIAALKK